MNFSESRRAFVKKLSALFVLPGLLEFQTKSHAESRKDAGESESGSKPRPECVACGARFCRYKV